MARKFLFNFLALILLTANGFAVNSAPASECICGKWISSEKNLIVQVYMHDNKFEAKIVWFKDTYGKPLDYWEDVHNPNESLRTRKILGLGILKDLTYIPASNTWENGTIYDPTHGRDWSSSAYIDKDGELKVKGYWHFKFIGKTLTFKRVA